MYKLRQDLLAHQQAEPSTARQMPQDSDLDWVRPGPLDNTRIRAGSAPKGIR